MPPFGAWNWRDPVARLAYRSSACDSLHVVGDAAQVVPAPSAPRVHRRRWLVVVGASIVVLLGSIVAALAVTFHYRYAASLTNQGGSFGWGPPDNLLSRFVHLGPYNGMVAPARPGHSQSFYVEIRNGSSVTQTILGIDDFGTGLAQREHLAVSTTDDDRVSSNQLAYRTGTSALPPHARRFVRYTIDTPRCPGPLSQYWDSLRVRVRVGAFTRTETITLSYTIFELTPPRSSC